MIANRKDRNQRFAPDLSLAAMRRALRRLRRGQFFTPLKNELRPLPRQPRQPRRPRQTAAG